MSVESHYENVAREYAARVSRDRSADQSEFLREEMQKAVDEENRHLIMSTLVSELQRHNRFTEAEVMLTELTSEDPAHPHHWIQFAEHYHYYDIDLVKALEKIETAVVKAKVTGDFVYQALAVKARLGIELDRCEVIVDALSQALEHKPKPGKIDVRPESDFLPRIPKDCMPEDILRRYQRISAPRP